MQTRNAINKPSGTAGNGAPSSLRWLWVLLGGCALVALIGFLRPPRPSETEPGRAGQDSSVSDGSRSSRGGQWRYTAPRPAASQHRSAAEAQEIVARKLKQFAQNRRELIHAYAKHLKTEVPAEMEAFFAAAETGSWEELRVQYEALDKRRKSDSCTEQFAMLWPAVLETYGVAEQTHDWPAQALLDYGEAVLGSLKPGMVYLGGTDPGRFIPTLLNETSEGERHVVLTQNALVDGSYLAYAGFQYGDQLAALTMNLPRLESRL